MTLDPEKFRPMIKNVARSVSSIFPPYVTLEDTEQALYLWLYQNRQSVLRAVEDGPEWEPKIASTMRKVAFDHCAKERADSEGYSVDDLYRYSLPKIKSLLEDVFQYEDWQTFGRHGDDQPTARNQANTTGDRMVELIDVKTAIETLPKETQDFLHSQYADHYTMESLAVMFDISVEAAKKRSQRAPKAIQKALGYKAHEEGPGPRDRRTVRSNAAARAAVSSSWDG